MSFQRALKHHAKLLKPTHTTITHPDGSRTLHNSTTTTQLPPTLGYIIDTSPDDTPAQITPHLYLGSQNCCTQPTLIKFNIKTILSIGIKAPNIYENINHEFINCLDLPETIINHILKLTNPIIDNCVMNKKNILVHCNAGVSRSPSVVIGYLINKGWSYEGAYQLVKKARPCIKPNAGFTQQLIELR